MTTQWMREAQGIEPWPKHYFEWLDNTGQKVGTSAFTDPWYKPDGDMKAIVNLDNPDVLAAFDRRLALRLGAPEEAVREGVMFCSFALTWIVWAGQGNGFDEGDFAWEHRLSYAEIGNADDPLLARVRAWNSIKETS